MYNFITPPDKKNKKLTKNGASKTGSISMMSLNMGQNTTQKKTYDNTNNDNVREFKSRQQLEQERSAYDEDNNELESDERNTTDSVNVVSKDWSKDLISSKLQQLAQSEKDADDKKLLSEIEESKVHSDSIEDNKDEQNYNSEIIDIKALLNKLNTNANQQEVTQHTEDLSNDNENDIKLLLKKLGKEEQVVKSEVAEQPSEVKTETQNSESQEQKVEQVYDMNKFMNSGVHFLNFGVTLDDEDNTSSDCDLLLEPDDDVNDLEDGLEHEQTLMSSKDDIIIKSALQDDIEEVFEDYPKEETAHFLELTCMSLGIRFHKTDNNLISFILDRNDNSYKRMNFQEKNLFLINYALSKVLYVEAINLFCNTELEKSKNLLQQICLCSVDIVTTNNAFSKLEEILKSENNMDELNMLVSKISKKEEEILNMIYSF